MEDMPYQRVRSTKSEVSGNNLKIQKITFDHTWHKAF
jgi:hypothetical protein